MPSWRIRHFQPVWEKTTVFIESDEKPTDEEAEAAIQRHLADDTAVVEIEGTIESMDSDLQIDPA